MAYCLSDREQTLWFSRADGASARRVIAPPTQSAFPQWSPDGSLVAVATQRLNMPWTISLISTKAGGSVRELKLIDGNSLHPNWSHDGKEILFGTIPTLEPNPYLYIVDVASEHISVLPGSQGLFSPSWSPDGRFIAALHGDSYQLVLLDRTLGRWFTLTDSKSGYPVWSRDGKSLYSVQRRQDGSQIDRFDPITRKRHQVMGVGDFPLIDRWMGCHPDGSLLLAKNASIQEIDLLKVEPTLSNMGR